MKIRRIIALTAGLSLSCSALASWQMVSSKTIDNHGPFFQAGVDNSIPNETASAGFSSTTFKSNYVPYELHVYPGTLKSNLERLMEKSQFKLLWNSKYDYRVVSEASIKGKNFNDALNNLLKNYPVNAVFYEQNNIMTIVSRKAQ